MLYHFYVSHAGALQVLCRCSADVWSLEILVERVWFYSDPLMLRRCYTKAPAMLLWLSSRAVSVIRRKFVGSLLILYYFIASALPECHRCTFGTPSILCRFLVRLLFYPELRNCSAGHMQKIPQCSDGDVRLLIRNSHGYPTSLHHYTSVLPMGI